MLFTIVRNFVPCKKNSNNEIGLFDTINRIFYVNIGTGKEVSIKELAETVKKTVGYEGDIVWNTDMPDGTPRKLTNVDKLHSLGFRHKVELQEGIELAYKWFCENVENARL